MILKTQKFEGPFDLLLELIRDKKMNILELDLNEITNQYLIYIKEWKNKNLEVASEYLVIAATLIEIKSSELIPQEKIKRTESEESQKQKFINRLIEYKQVKEYAELLKQKELENLYYITKKMSNLEEFVIEKDDLPLPDFMSPNVLQRMMFKVMNNTSTDTNNLDSVEMPNISVSPDVISSDLVKFLKSRKSKSTLNDFFIAHLTKDKKYNVQYFLIGVVVALDLSFKNIIKIEQRKEFQDLEISLMEV